MMLQSLAGTPILAFGKSLESWSSHVNTQDTGTTVDVTRWAVLEACLMVTDCNCCCPILLPNQQLSPWLGATAGVE